MTTDAVLLYIHRHITHSHGKVCFADICSMLPGSIHGVRIMSHVNLCYISPVCLERPHHPEGILHGQGSPQAQSDTAGSHPTVRKGRWSLTWDPLIVPVSPANQRAGKLQAAGTAQCTGSNSMRTYNLIHHVWQVWDMAAAHYFAQMQVFAAAEKSAQKKTTERCVW